MMCDFIPFKGEKLLDSKRQEMVGVSVMMFYDFMKIFITSGGTKVPIDEVRAITNNSKGTYAAAIASRFAERLHPKKDHLYFSYSKDSMHPAKNYPQGFGGFFIHISII